MAQRPMHRASQTGFQLVGALHALLDAPLRVQPFEPGVPLGQLATGIGQAQPRGCVQAPPQPVDIPQPGPLVGADLLGGGRGGRRAHVGGEVGDGHVDLVAHAGHHRDRAGADGAGHGLVVEGPQILQGAAAAHQQEDVAVTAFAGAPQGAHDRRRGGLALHGHRVQQDFAQRVAPAQDRQHVPDRGPGGRGDHAAASRPGGRLALDRRVEQALAGQLALELLEGPLQGAVAGVLQVLGDELEIAARRV